MKDLRIKTSEQVKKLISRCYLENSIGENSEELEEVGRAVDALVKFLTK